MEFNKEISNLLNDYYVKRKTVKVLVEEYDLDKPNRIYEQFPKYLHQGMLCECCGETLISDFASRDHSTLNKTFHQNIYEKEPLEVENTSLRVNQYHGRFLNLEDTNNCSFTKEGFVVCFPNCPSCGHKPSLKCKCDMCLAFRERNKQIAVTKVLNSLQDVNNPIDVDDYSSKDIFIVLYLLTYFIEDIEAGFEPKNIGPISKEQLLRTSLLALDLREESLSKSVSMVSNMEFMFLPEKIQYLLNTNESFQKADLLAVLKRKALKAASTMEGQIELVELWSELALEEALGVLKHYCVVYKIQYRPGETILSTIKRCLNKYGLAQTARYIFNSAKNAHSYAAEKGISGAHVFNCINGSLNFWMDDEKCRTWNAPPFSRSKGILEEPKYTIVFSHSFLEAYGVDFFTHPTNLKSFTDFDQGTELGKSP